MVKPSITVRTVTDGSVKAAKNFKDLKTLAVYVGIPEASPSRRGEEISNAELTFILTHGARTVDARRIMGAMMNRGLDYGAAQALYVRSRGSMAFRIPPRPIIEPAIELDKDKIIPELKAAAAAQLDGNRTGAVTGMKRTGMTAQNIVRNFFTDPRNNWPPNAPSTIRRKGSSRPNISTGQLRAAMTYVLADGTK
jgi:hypothetical protein